MSQTEPSFTRPGLQRLRHKRPYSIENLVIRQRLIDKLNENYRRRLTYISGPAGYGKTALVCSWLEVNSIPSVWLSLEKDDNDLVAFLSYLASGIQAVFPGSLSSFVAMLHAVVIPPLDVLTTELVNRIEVIGQEFILVLDDFDLVHEKSIHKILISIMNYLSECLHLVVICRENPKLPIAKLRVKLQLNEITAADLCFTLDETYLFFQKALNMEIQSQYINILYERTEGWAAGLQLAAISMSPENDLSDFVKKFTGSHRNVLEYFSEEVLSHLSRDVQEFLLRTSILNRLCAPLCKSLIQGDQDMFYYEHLLQRLEKNGLVLVPLDNQHVWYRYNHLFQELLIHRLEMKYGSQEITKLHKMAGDWFAANGQINEALDHLVTSGDMESAVKLVEDNINPALNDQKWRDLERWFTKLPSHICANRPALLLAQAWLLFYQFKLTPFNSLLNSIDDFVSKREYPWKPGEREILQAELDILQSAVQVLQPGSLEVTGRLQRALTFIPNNWHYVRSTALGWIAFYYQFTGQENEALEVLNGELNSSYLVPGYVCRLLTNIANLHRIAGRLTELQVSAQKLLWMAEKDELMESGAWAHYLLGVAEYENNHLAAARQHFNEVVSLRYYAQDFAFRDSLFGMALVCMAEGRSEEAKAIADDLFEYAIESGDQVYLSMVRSFHARLALMSGEVENAARHLPVVIGEKLFSSGIQFEIDSITYCWFMIVSKNPADNEQGRVMLERLAEPGSRIHSRWLVIQVLLLQALDRYLRGETKDAMDSIEEALAAGRPGGFIRIYADLGQDIVSLLRAYRRKQGQDAYLDSIIDACNTNSQSKQIQVGVKAVGNLMDESLTRREIEILRLVRDNLSDKDIARRLVISTLTVKKHLRNIYQKLQVNGRRQAVARGNSLNSA